MDNLKNVMNELHIETQEELVEALFNKKDQRPLIRELRNVFSEYAKRTEKPIEYQVDNNE